MADNPSIDPGPTPSVPVAGDDIGGVIYQRVKLRAADDGSAGADVSTANPLPVLSTTPVLEVAFTTTSVQAVATTDVGAYAWVSVHVVTQGGSSLVTFQGSNDNTNWLNVTLQNAGLTSAATTTGTTAAGIMFNGPLTYRYFRLNVTGIASGTTAGVVEFFQRPKAYQAGLTQASPADAASGSLATTATAFNMGWNGSSWDRLRSTIANGLAVGEVRAATGAAPTAFTATSSTQVFASNASRKLFTVYNNSDKDLFLMLAAAAVSVTSYHVKVPANGGFFSTTDYSGEIRGIMSAAIGTGQVNPGEYT